MVRAPNGVEITRIPSKVQALNFYTQQGIDWTPVSKGKELLMVDLLVNARYWKNPNDSDVEMFVILGNDSIHAIINSKPVLGYFYGDYFLSNDAQPDHRNMIEAYVKFNGYKTTIWFSKEINDTDQYVREIKASHIKKK